MDILLIILAFVALLIGLLGCVVPVLPGPPIAYVGLLLARWSGYVDFSNNFLFTMAAITAVVTAIDFLLPVWMTRRFGGSRKATVGAGIGLVAGLFILPPLGIILFPFLGALAGELLNNREESAKAFKVALASFAAFMLGTGLKVILCGVMVFYVISGMVA